MKPIVAVGIWMMMLSAPGWAGQGATSLDDPAAGQTSVQDCQASEGCLSPDGTYRDVSCNQARSILRGQGFSDVKTLNCTGNHYDFLAVMTGAVYKLRVRHADGEVSVLERRAPALWDQ